MILCAWCGEPVRRQDAAKEDGFGVICNPHYRNLFTLAPYYHRLCWLALMLDVDGLDPTRFGLPAPGHPDPASH